MHIQALPFFYMWPAWVAHPWVARVVVMGYKSASSHREGLIIFLSPVGTAPFQLPVCSFNVFIMALFSRWFFFIVPMVLIHHYWGIDEVNMFNWLVVWNIWIIFHNIWDNPSHWLILFKMVKTTNQFFFGEPLVRKSKLFFPRRTIPWFTDGEKLLARNPSTKGATI